MGTFKLSLRSLAVLSSSWESVVDPPNMIPFVPPSTALKPCPGLFGGSDPLDQKG